MQPHTKQILALKLGVNHIATILQLRDGGKKISEVSAAIGTTSAAMTSIVPALVDRGLITKQPHPTDTRVKLISLTTKGEKLAKQL